MSQRPAGAAELCGQAFVTLLSARSTGERHGVAAEMAGVAQDRKSSPRPLVTAMRGAYSGGAAGLLLEQVPRHGE